MAKALEHRYAPWGAARQLFEDRSGEILLHGPAGTGKSRACLEKIFAACVKYPGANMLMVRQTHTSLTSTGLQTWRKFVIPEAESVGAVRYYGGSQSAPPQYIFDNGSTVLMGGLDQPTKIMSSEYDMIFVQEATEASVTSWEMLLTRLRGDAMPYQQLIADCNPNAPTHWLRQRSLDGALRMMQSRHEDNPILFDADGHLTERGRVYISRLDALTGVRLKRLRHGLWVAAEGTIFEEQWSDEYVVDPFPIPDSWTRVWGVDFGYTNPMVVQCWAIAPSGRMILYRELYRTRRTVLDNCKDLMATVAPGGYWDGNGAYRNGKWIEPRPDWIVVDHDAEDRATFERAIGQGTTPADKRVKVGLDTMQERMANGGIHIMRGALMDRDPYLDDQLKPCGFLEEIPAYSWRQVQGKVIAKEEPLKENDHSMDAGRYVVMQLDGGLDPGVRFL